jgi:hypothetical protein
MPAELITLIARDNVLFHGYRRTHVDGIYTPCSKRFALAAHVHSLLTIADWEAVKACVDNLNALLVRQLAIPVGAWCQQLSRGIRHNRSFQINLRPISVSQYESRGMFQARHESPNQLAAPRDGVECLRLMLHFQHFYCCIHQTFAQIRQHRCCTIQIFFRG